MMSGEPAMLLATDALTLQSARNGRTYRITVSVPLGHDAAPDEPWPFNDRPEKWPTVYVLDGNWYAGMVAGMIIGSPTLSYGNRFMFEREAAFAKQSRALPASIYLFAGEYEESLNDTTLTDTLRLAAILQGRKYDGLSLIQQVFADQNHCEVAAPGFQMGLKRALKR